MKQDSPIAISSMINSAQGEQAPLGCQKFMHYG